MKLKKKELEFQKICVAWDCETMDAEPYLEKITIGGNYIMPRCSKYVDAIGEYIYCYAEPIEDKSLIKKFKRLNLNNDNDVLEFMNEIGSHINWEQVSKALNNIKETIIKNEMGDEIEEDGDEVEYVSANKLGEGWVWCNYNDGSGHLESPEGKKYMTYDLSTNEYKVTESYDWDFFPLSYYYADGYSPSSFNAFEYMEDYMLNYVLEKDEEVSL